VGETWQINHRANRTDRCVISSNTVYSYGYSFARAKAQAAAWGEDLYIIIESKLRGVWKKCGRFIDCHSVLYVWCMFVCTPDVGAHACCSQVVQRRFYVVAWRQPNTKRSMFWYYSSVVWIPVQVDVTTLIPPSQLSEREMVSSELLFCFLTCNVPFSL